MWEYFSARDEENMRVSVRFKIRDTGCVDRMKLCNFRVEDENSIIEDYKI